MTDWVIGWTWRTVQQRSSSSCFCRRPQWAVLAWAGMSTLWHCPSSISSADHSITHPPRCLDGWFWRGFHGCDNLSKTILQRGEGFIWTLKRSDKYVLQALLRSYDELMNSSCTCCIKVPWRPLVSYSSLKAVSSVIIRKTLLLSFLYEMSWYDWLHAWWWWQWWWWEFKELKYIHAATACSLHLSDHNHQVDY